MCRIQSVLGLVALCVVLAQSWELAISKGELLEFYTNGSKTVTVRFESQKLAALAYDQVHNMMLYVDKKNDNDTICGYNISSMQYKCLIERNGRNIRGLAVDPATELVFFTDTKERTINWISLKPESKNNVYGNVLIKMHDGIPTDIAVDSCRGYIYWINTDLTTPTIERARFDGTERKVIINLTSMPVNTTHKLEPHSLVIDQRTQNIHWVEYVAKQAYQVYNTDLEGKQSKSAKIYHDLTNRKVWPNTLNKLAVSKHSIYVLTWYSNICVMDFWKVPGGPIRNYDVNTDLDDEMPASIASNYDIIDQIKKPEDCKTLMNLVRNNPEKVESFCVHGTKLNGQSLCECPPGYIGERCDVSVCENYCIQGNCSSNDEGLPECSCNIGYSGERCEINECQGYCMNNGECSLNEENNPVCECGNEHQGSRCEDVNNDDSTTTCASFSAERHFTLADIFSNFKEPISKFTITVESN